MGIKVENVSFTYQNGREALKNVSFKIDDGDFVGIVGPTGCGKTTLLYCLNGLIPNSIKGKFSGEVYVDGISTKSLGVSELAKKIGIVFQDPDWQLFNLSVKDEVAFGPKNLKFNNIEERVKSALSLVGLNGFEDAEPFRLSQGQKQKLCIACVLAMNPKIILLDEPTSNLDYKNTKQIYSILKRLNMQGKTIVIIEHDTDLLVEHANKIILLNNGEIIRNGSVEEVLSDVNLLEEVGVKVPRCFEK